MIRVPLLRVALSAALLAPSLPARIEPGELVPDFELGDLDGRVTSLSALAREGGVVLVLRDEACPLCRRYGPRLAQLEAEWGARGIRFAYLNPGDAEDPAALAADRERFAFAGPYVADRSGRIGRTLGAATTTEVFLVDASRTLRYRGAVDDQHGIGVSREAPTQAWLLRALEALAAGKAPAVQRTAAPGCVLELGEGEVLAGEEAPTWNGTISRLLAKRCGACHREGGVAPFALDTYERATRRKATVEQAVREGVMPPWGAAEGSGPWRNDFGLRAAEREQLFAWIAAGAPEGPAELAPRVLESPGLGRAEGWSLGEPDLVLELPREEKVPAQGKLPYRYRWVATGLEEDRWVRAVEFRATAPEVVHHVLTFVEDPPQNLREANAKRNGGLRGYFAGLVPGQGPTVFPEGTGKLLPAGSHLKFQLHYTANGVATTDRTRMALWFHDGPPAHELHTSSAAQVRFEIPPGAPAHEVQAVASFSAPTFLHSFAPHMHLRGKAFRYELELPDGERRLLLDIPRYDFDWQVRYELEEPLLVPAQAVLRATAWFDNSAANPANPDPSRTVRFGEQTWDEMMIGYFEWWR